MKDTEIQRLRRELAELSLVAHAAWHMLDESGEYEDDDGLKVVSTADWEALAAALDVAGWHEDFHGEHHESIVRAAEQELSE